MRGLTAVVLTVALAGCASSGVGDAGQVAPLRLDELHTMDGNTVDLDAALKRGETVALVFWQTWCGSCKTEAPRIVQAQRKHGDKIHFVGVIPGRDERVDDTEVSETARAWGYAFPQVRDRDLALTRGLGVTGTPTIVVLGKDRQVLHDSHRPPDDWAALEGAITRQATPRDGLTPLGEAECEDGVCPLPEEP